MKLEDISYEELLWHKEKIKIVLEHYEEPYELIYDIGRWEFFRGDDIYWDYKDYIIEWFEPCYDKDTDNCYITFYISKEV